MKKQDSDESWLKSKVTEFKEEHLLELWKQYQTSEVAFLDLHFKYASWYSAFFITLLAAYVVGLAQYIGTWNAAIFLAIPILVIVLAQLAKKAMDRFYQRFLETVTMIAKIEQLLGFDSTIQTEPKRKYTVAFWLKDKQFIPERYFYSRHSDETSKDFINNNLRKGVNKIVCNTFLAFQVIAAVLVAAGLVLIILSN